ncbi:hypothetical protein [Wolbachia endosymbiont (group E) of Neria commutata]|uniref:hypothetical protein n=1 Tax=Wolbachia endosymbiont (group E) of Neria commutata TaxID=3066149 RepID=UPI0031330B06
MLRSIGEILRPKRAAEAKKTSNKPKEEGFDVKFATETAANVSDVIEYLLKLHSYKDKNEFRKHVDRGALSYLASLKDKFVLLKSKLDEAEKANPSVKDLAIVRFCRSIAENDKLHKELNNLAKRSHNIAQSLDDRKKSNNLARKHYNIPRATSYERLYPQLDKIVGNLNKDKLKEKISFLKKLKEKSDFNAIRNDYNNAWDFDDLLRELMGDKNFKEEYIDKALDEEGKSFSKSFKENLNKYIELANESVKAARKCLGEEVGLQTYYTQINDTDRVLNINIIGRDKNEPTKISDLLQKEENTSELNIYYKKKHEVHAYRDEKERRHYEFKEDASYEMTSTWPVNCTMVMNVSSNGITEIVEFNGRKPGLLSKDDLKLVQQNYGLHIQGLSFYDGVKKWLSSQCGESFRVTEKGKKKDTVTVPSAVPVVAGNNLQEDKAIEVKQNPNDKGIDTNLDSLSNAGVVVCNTPASEVTKTSKIEIGTQIEVQPQKTVAGTQTEFHSQQAAAETQTKINTQQIAIQTEVGSQQIKDELQKITIGTQTNQTKVSTQQATAETQTEISTQQIAIQTEIGLPQMDELANSKQEVSKLKKENVELKAVEADLQVMNQKHHELMQEKQLLLEELKTTKVEKEELSQKFLKTIELDERIKHVNEQLKNHVEKLNGQKCGLQGEIKKIEQEFEREKGFMNQRIADAQQKVVELSRRDSDLRCEIAEARQIIERLEQQNSDLQVRDKSANQVIESLEKQNGNLQIENSDLKGDLIETKQKIKKLEQENGDLRAKDREIIEKFEEENSSLQIQNNKMCEELAKLNTILKEKEKEVEGAREEKENVEKKLGVLSQQNVALNSMVKKLTEDLTKAEEYAEYLMGESNKAKRGFRSQMLELEQNYKEQLKSSAKGIEEQEWKLKELQNELELRAKELQSKKKKFEEAGKVYEELEAENKKLKEDLNLQRMENDMKEGMLNRAVHMRASLEHKIEKLKEKVERLEDTIVGQARENENLTKQNEDLTKEVESLKECVERFIEDNTADAAGIKHLIKTNPENYKLTQDVENIILSTQLSRPPSSDSYDGALDSKSVYPLNPTNSKKMFNSTDAQKMNKISKDHKYAFDVLAEAAREVVKYASQKKQPLSKSSSIDSGCGSDKENCDNRSSGPSGFGPISSKILIERAARSTSSSPNVAAVKS